MEKSETYFGIMTLILKSSQCFLKESGVPQHGILRVTKEHIWMGFIRVLKIDHRRFSRIIFLNNP